ncbi:MAG TPA: ATP-binding protein [Gammaproteobacteria bacterium]|nr:ATP-binding protein [Gammaproteobacteria bacterium]
MQRNNTTHSANFVVTRSVWLLSGLAAMLIVLSLGLFIFSTWRHFDSTNVTQQHMHYLRKVEVTDFEARTKLIRLLESESGHLNPNDLDNLARQLQELLDSTANLEETTPNVIRHALNGAHAFDGSSRHRLDEILYDLRIALNQELVAHQQLVSDLQSEAQRGWRIALGLALGILLTSALLWAMARQRILNPLNRLADQLTLLTHSDYSRLPSAQVDPLLYPIYEKYNDAVQRLRKMEQLQQERQQTLTREVRSATHMLLQQQFRLSQAERLGAIGELAAGLAHELRNPMTSVQMALENLRQDIQEAETAERIDMIIDEVKRVTGLLNQQLEQARHRPETPVMVDVCADIETLIALASYQLPEDIRVRFEGEENLTCLLPRSRLRQIMLNLILNAGQALNGNAGDILVRARCHDQELELGITDTGPGFPRTLLDSWVQPFRSTRPGGTGIGLVMVKRFVDDLGGKLQLSNKPEGGACVTLLLPCRLNDG